MRFFKSPPAGAGGTIIILTAVAFVALLLISSAEINNINGEDNDNINVVKLNKEATPYQKLHRTMRPFHVLQSSKRKVPNASDPLHNR